MFLVYSEFVFSQMYICWSNLQSAHNPVYILRDHLRQNKMQSVHNAVFSSKESQV